jgi:low affinity Fe/Cu permease
MKRSHKRRWSCPDTGEARKGSFDRFPQRCGGLLSKAPFFTFCVTLVVLWAPSFYFMDFGTWQLLVNTPRP